MFLLALSPILWLVVALSILKMAAHKACAIALVISLAVGCGIYGMETVNAIAKTATNYADRPLQDQRIKTMTVDTFGVDYPEPNKLKER